MEDTFITYKKALKAQYEIIKEGEYANFLLNPTAANLRNLVLLIFEENQQESDSKVFERFMGFEYKSTAIHNINKQTDKFKPISTFLKGTTELSNIETADMLAIILDFKPRPYRYFIKRNSPSTNTIEPEIYDSKDRFLTPNISETQINVSNNLVKGSKPSSLNKKRAVMVSMATGIIALGTSAYYNLVDTSSEKKCMTWDEYQYELVDCNHIKQGFVYQNNLGLDEKLLDNFKKIKVDSTTKFFDRKNQPLVWYGKNANKEYEFFSYYGIHPETGKTLKPISNYIINKYIKNKKSNEID